MSQLRKLWPEIEPYCTHRLQVSKLHNIYVEECGNVNGTPVIVLHGGPGSGSYPDLRRFFDPTKYHIILFDQRGAGKSTPLGELNENTTQDLVSDIECIRKKLSITKWLVFGGSWGSTLALAYAIAHPAKVTGLVLRGIFLGDEEWRRFFFEGEGLQAIFPDEYERFMFEVPFGQNDDVIAAYHRLLTSEDGEVRKRATEAWCRYEEMTSQVVLPPDYECEPYSLELEALARIECHYFLHHCFLKRGELLLGAKVLANIPTIIVQGRYDMVTPCSAAFRLLRVLPKAKFILVQNEGHWSMQPGIQTALLNATDEIVKFAPTKKK